MASESNTLMKRCTICPRDCGVDRSVTAGYCKSLDTMMISKSQLHFWEEPVISGTAGSGTVFFSNCTMRCEYCQNFMISQEGLGAPRSVEDLCAMMLELQAMGAHNVNLVTASHYTPRAADALRLARERGLRIPAVWNSNAYEKPETLRLLEGLVDIYLPDFRYYDADAAVRYSHAPDYPAHAKRAILEMFRQTGHLAVKNDMAQKGLIIRLLVLPGRTASIRDILTWIRGKIGPETWISLMGQYYPVYRSHEHPEINRSVTAEEYEQCLGYLDDLGFENGFTQEVGSCADYTPDFSQEYDE